MGVQERRRAISELELLASRAAGGRPALPRSWGRARALLAEVADAPPAELDELLIDHRVGPVAAALIALRLHGLDAAEAALLAQGDFEVLAEQRLHSPEGRALRVEVLRWAECRREKLDGSGPLGLTAEQLDPEARAVAAAWAFVDRGGGLAGLVAVAGRPDLYEGHGLLRAVSAFPLGTYVRLSTGELGRVVRLSDDPLRPLVCVRVAADGSLVSPPVLQDQPDAPRIVGFIDEPLAEAPAPEEPVLSWLQRLAAADPFRQTPAPLPEGLRGEWGPALRETDRRWAREEDRRKQALYERLTSALERSMAEHSRRALEDEAVILAEEARAVQERLTQHAAARAAGVGEIHGARMERFALRQAYFGALERLGLERTRAEDALAALHVVNLERLWESKVGELGALWRELSERRAQSERRRREREVEDARLRDRLRRRVEKARALRAEKAAQLRARAEQALKDVEEARAEVARLHDLAKPWADAAAALAAERETWLAGAPEREAERRRHEERLVAVEADIERFKDSLAKVDAAQLDDAVRSRESMAALRKDLAKSLRQARAAAGLPQLRRRIKQAEAQLTLERARAAERAKAADAERQAAAEALAQARARATEQTQRWDVERRELQAKLIEKRRRLDELRRAEAEATLRKEAAQTTAREGLAAFETAAAEKIVAVRRALAKRRELLERSLSALTAEAAESARLNAEAQAAFEARRGALEEEVRRLRAEWGDAQGLLAAQEADATALRKSLQAALSELDLRLLEANFAAENAKREAESLAREQEKRAAEWERGRLEMEGLAARFEELAGKIEPLLTPTSGLAAEGLAGVSAVFREQLLGRARELSLWDSRLAEVDRKLSAAREAFAAQLFVRARESALRALREGRVPEALEALRRALALKEDAELRALLKSHEA